MKYNLKRWMALLLSLLMLLAPAALADDLSRMIEQGAAFLAEGDDESAATCYEIAVKLAPDDAAALKGYAQALMALERYDEAMTYLNRALDVSPADPALYLMRCETHLIISDADSAAKDVRYAELCGGEVLPELYARLGQAFSDAGDYPAALDAFEKAGDTALTGAYADAYKRTLVATDNRDRAEALNLIQPGQKDSQLAAAMEAGAAFRLEREALDISDCPVFCSAYYSGMMEEQGIRGTFTEDGKRYKVFDSFSAISGNYAPEEIKPLAVSPDGDTCLFAAGGALYIHRDGELTVVASNPDRGPEDQGKAQLARLEGRLSMMLEQDGVAWSPDGRYAALTFAYRALHQGTFFDLMLLDVESGDLYLCESTPQGSIDEGAGTALYALFAENGRSLYYVVYGDIGDEGCTALKRYDLETGTAETLIVSPDNLFWPGLFMDDEGVLRCLINNTKGNPSGIMHFFSGEDGWGADAEYFDAPDASADVLMDSFRRMQYASNSGLTLLTDDCDADTSVSTIQVLDDGDMESTQGMAVMLPADGGRVAERVDEQSLAESFALALGEDGELNPDLLPWKLIANSAVSPDGYYALLVTYAKGEYALQLLDMQTLALADVKLPEEMTLGGMRTQSRLLIGDALQWIDENRVLLSTSEGNALFTLTWE